MPTATIRDGRSDGFEESDSRDGMRSPHAVITILERGVPCRQVTEVDCALVCSDYVTGLKCRALVPIFRDKSVFPQPPARSRIPLSKIDSYDRGGEPYRSQERGELSCVLVS